MGLDPQPGMSVHLPCRNCGRLVSVKLVRGRTAAPCAKCSRTTEVELYSEGAGWRIRTRPVSNTAH